MRQKSARQEGFANLPSLTPAPKLVHSQQFLAVMVHHHPEFRAKAAGLAYLGDMTVKEAARRLGVTRPNLSRILNGRAGISAAMSVRLAKPMPYTSPKFWLKMQLNYDLSKAQKRRQPKIKPFASWSQKEFASA